MHEIFNGKKKDRPVYVFKVPKTEHVQADGSKEEVPDVPDEFVTDSFGLVKLDMDQETAAAERAGKNGAKLGYNLARMSLVQVDGRMLNKGEGEDEKILRHCDPAMRELIVEAYDKISSAPEGASKKMLASMKVVVT